MSAAGRRYTDGADEEEVRLAAEGARNLPDTFWQARPTLAAIRAAAWARQRSPDAVLGAYLATVAASLPHILGLPAIVGSEAGLSLLVAIVAPPGSGKSNATGIAHELYDGCADLQHVTGGTGEGMAEALFITEVVTDETGKRRQRKMLQHHNLLAVVDEGSKLTAIQARSGSTLYATYRSAFTGTTLGEANASEERKRVVPAGEYTMGVVAIYQPTVLGSLFDDLHAGTPQRFLYLSGTDPRIPDDRPEWPGRLVPRALDLTEATRPLFGLRPHHLKVAQVVAEEIQAADLARQRGRVTVDPWHAHRNLLRLKLAALLAIMEGRVVATSDDWQLAGTVVDASDAVRQAAQEAIRHQGLDQEQATAKRLGRRAVATEDMLDDHRTHKAADLLAAMVRRHPGELTPGRARSRLTTNLRGYAEQALDYAQEADWIRLEVEPGQGQDKARLVPGKQAP